MCQIITSPSRPLTALGTSHLDQLRCHLLLSEPDGSFVIGFSARCLVGMPGAWFGILVPCAWLGFLVLGFGGWRHFFVWYFLPLRHTLGIPKDGGWLSFVGDASENRFLETVCASRVVRDQLAASMKSVAFCIRN